MNSSSGASSNASDASERAPSRYLAITGGVGGAKLCLGLSHLLPPEALTFVVNTGDDFEHLGLKICPDLDTLTYTLSDEANPETGWGRRDETWQALSALTQLGAEDWFRLGDRDLALHLFRSAALRDGESLTSVTARITSALGIDHRALPMSDEPVPTIIHTHAEDLAFQHYFVRERCEPSVTGFSFKGAAEAPVNPEIELILNDPELAGIIICPSNPYVSIDPILATGDLRQQLIEAPAPVIAVSPIIGGEAVKGPTAKMMQELAVPNSATSIAEHYADLLDGFVIDTVDAELQSQIASARELTITVAPTWMKTLDDRIRLGQHCLDLCQELGQH